MRKNEFFQEAKENVYKISEGFLWILAIGVFIVAIYAGCAVGPALCLEIIGGGLVVLIFFGVYAELANNVLDIKRILEKNGYNPSNSTSGKTASIYTAAKMDTVSQTAQKKEQGTEGWFCSNCGYKNDTNAVFCMNCGKKNE